jgi:hypothetical protein
MYHIVEAIGVVVGVVVAAPEEQEKVEVVPVNPAATAVEEEAVTDVSSTKTNPKMVYRRTSSDQSQGLVFWLVLLHPKQQPWLSQMPMTLLQTRILQFALFVQIQSFTLPLRRVLILPATYVRCV